MSFYIGEHVEKTKMLYQELLGSWRDGSVVKITDCCSSRGPDFNSQQPHGGSQPSVMGSNALFWCVWCSNLTSLGDFLTQLLVLAWQLL